jgi:eukaryotic-like serine/threonine-protein kinase
VAVALLAGGEEDPSDPPTAQQSEPTSQPNQPRQTQPTTPQQTQDSPTPTEDNTVQVDESDYVGRDVDEVEDELTDLGLQVRRDEQENPGDEEEDSVESVDPSGTLQEGDTVTVSYWGPPPTEETPGPPSVPPGQEKQQ